MSRAKKCYDYLGNEYNSMSEMCETYGINYLAYLHRINCGWDIKKALTTPVKEKPKKCKDHLGNEYNSIKEMCEAYDIPYQLFNRRQQSKCNWDIERILTEPTLTTGKICKDHLGNEYSSISEMCRAYNICVGTYKRRIKEGWTLEKALTVKQYQKINNKRWEKCYDHLGNAYNSWSEMCRAYGINRNTFHYRVHNNWTLEEILTGKKFYDHLGNVYNSEYAMCKAHHISQGAYRDRIKRGLSVEQALTPVKK